MNDWMMSKNAWSPGRIRRSVKLCGCGRAALAGDRVDRLDAVRAHLVQALRRERDDLALLHAGLERFGDVLVNAVDHRGGHVEQRDLVDALDLARLQHRSAGRRARRCRASAARTASAARRRRRRAACRRRLPASRSALISCAASRNSVHVARRPRRACRAARRGNGRDAATARGAGDASRPSRNPRCTDRRCRSAASSASACRAPIRR